MKTTPFLVFLALAVLSLSPSLSAQAPNITEIRDGAGVAGNLAQGSVFIVKGTGLSATGIVQATAPAYPVVLNNVQITFTPAFGGGAVRQMLMVYTYNVERNQLAGIIQSTVALGVYDVRVINGGATSAPVRAIVVARKPGIVTSDGSGEGIAQATLEGRLILQRNSVMGNINGYDTRPAHPGDRMDLWGTGLGADVASDTGGTSGDQTVAGQIRVVLNGVEIVPAYAGRSQGYPGLDQIVFTIPASVALKCDNTLQVRASGNLSNLVTIATSAASATACPTSNPGGGNGACPVRANVSQSNVPTQAEVDEWAASGLQCSGGFSVSRLVNYSIDFGTAGNPLTITRKDTAGANFIKTTGSDLTRYLNNTAPPAGYLVPAPGVCNIFSTTIVDPYPNLTTVNLDAGTPLTVTGPNGARNVPRSTNSVGRITYGADTGAGTPGNWMDPGTYTHTGPGSAVVGSFSGSQVVPAEFVVTNPNALGTINRSAGVTVTWTGGDPTTLVFITGSSFVSSATGAITGASFQCYENNTVGRFSVPLSILQQLPASGSITAGPVSIVLPGSLGVSSISKQVRIPVPGIDVFTLSSSYNYAFTSRYQ